MHFISGKGRFIYIASQPPLWVPLSPSLPPPLPSLPTRTGFIFTVALLPPSSLPLSPPSLPRPLTSSQVLQSAHRLAQHLDLHCHPQSEWAAPAQLRPRHPKGPPACLPAGPGLPRRSRPLPRLGGPLHPESSPYLAECRHHSRGQQAWRASLSMEDTWLPVGGLVMKTGVVKRKTKKARPAQPTGML